MANRNTPRSRRGRNQQQPNNWDWYYYEYDYTPYYGTRGNYYGAPYNHDPYYDPYYSRNYNGPYFRNRDYDRDFDYTSGSSYPYGYGDYGQYSGYGPSGYTRPDDRITDDINDRLTWDPRLDATDINVSVNDGIVTLTGSVDSRQDKRIAEDIVDDVSGVWDVNNQLRVRNRGYYRGQRAGAQRDQLHTGMQVVDRNGDRVGTVKEVRDSDFLLDRADGQDYFVPFGECHVEYDQVKLDALSSEIDNQGWMQAETRKQQRKS